MNDPVTDDSVNKDFALRFDGPNLLQIAMPLGGVGAGNVCFNGHGGLQDFSIRNQPATSAMPDGHGFTDSVFALLRVVGEGVDVTRLVEGPLPKEKVYDQGLGGQGYRKGGHEGLPRFSGCTFLGRFPFGTVELSDPRLPVRAEVTGWSPFVPRDDVVSGLPAAILEYTLTNTCDSSVRIEFSFHASHLAPGSGGEKSGRNARLPGGRGVLFTNSDAADAATFGSAAIAIGPTTSDVSAPAVKAMWFRGGWFDSLSALWREVSTGTFGENDGKASEGGLSGRNGGSVLVRTNLAPGESVTIPVVVAWHFPNVAHSVGQVERDTSVLWHPFYTSRFADASAIAGYVLGELDSLRQRTSAFADALYSSTLPPAAIDAVSANLAILKSPTVLRQQNGNLWGWEGCFVGSGCCHGTCTHVWNYAQALPHLFPALERTLREQEFLRSLDNRGHGNFRSALPDAPTTHDFHAAADGQLGGILKLWREWRICGDTDWLTRLYPFAKKSLDFCIGAWDPDDLGALIEPHHNTYDIEFWGPDGMCSTIYLGALCAAAKMARALGKEADAARYDDLAQKSAAYLDTHLFNGDYYQQNVVWDNLRDSSFAVRVATIPDDSDDEMALLLKREGPKYQYGTGCLSDGVIGAWMSSLYGVDTPLSSANVQSHLRAVFAHNFKPDLSEHACLQRPGYAVGDEAGLLLCSWPRGGMPTLPFVYSDEVWTGIEYQVAAHCIAEGLVDEGLAIVAAARSRFDGRVRNPYNEYECGNYYARAMSSYAVLIAVTGFRYDAVDRTLTIAPKLDLDPFVTFFSAETGYGTITLTGNSLTIEMVEGTLAVDTIQITRGGDTQTLRAGVTATPDAPARIEI